MREPSRYLRLTLLTTVFPRLRRDLVRAFSYIFIRQYCAEYTVVRIEIVTYDFSQV